MRYGPNPKHKEPWQRGRKGSLCPPMPRSLPQEVLEQSVPYGQKRYACHEGRAYCAQCHGQDRWHGYPVDWWEVPPSVRSDWLARGFLTKRQMRRGED
jgi:mono/diheme cytochrome c family protein